MPELWDAGWITTYGVSFLWAMRTLTGYGALWPISDSQFAVAVFTNVVGVAYYAAALTVSPRPFGTPPPIDRPRPSLLFYVTPERPYEEGGACTLRQFSRFGSPQRK